MLEKKPGSEAAATSAVADLSEALRRAGAELPAADYAGGTSPLKAVEEALTAPIGRPICTTHSAALAGELVAKGESIKAQVADIDAQIEALEAQREDLMLAYSMISHAMTARETGARN